ncbi:MAG: TIGR02186 family protein [Deltaproteobacteria bacterium]|nr:TIGR02186 family protein [Deltaproteobacteria bacterium]MBW2071342.1 TIGR02186 family protein [Deltaproteobacteria bacterium]
MLKRIVICQSIALLFLLGKAPASRANSITAHLNPERIEIGAFFNGSKVFVSGVVPADSEVAVRLAGMRQEVALKKKGKALGLLWMNLGSVTVRNAPSLYLLCLSEKLQELARENPEQWQALNIGFTSLKREMSVDSDVDADDADSILEEFIRLKKSEGLYAVGRSSISYGELNNDGKPYKAIVEIPPRLTPGKYLLEVIAVANGRVLATEKNWLEVEEVGFPAFLTVLAFNHGALYGLLATIVAIAAGLLMGVIFKGEKGAH